MNYLEGKKIVCTFALAFEKSSIPQGDKERVLWKILHKQTSSTRSGWLLRNKEVDWVKETNRQEIDKSGLLSFNKRKRIFVLSTDNKHFARSSEQAE